MGTIEEATIDRIIASFGEAFVRYILGIEGNGDIKSSIQDKHESALQLLLSSMQQALTVGDGSVNMTFVAPTHFTTYRPHLNGTLAQKLREISGAAAEKSIKHSDPVVNPLCQIARDVWPSMLIISNDSRFPRMFHNASFSTSFTHPDMITACKAIMSDKKLKKLFPGHFDIKEVDGLDSKLMQISSNWTMSDGSGGTTQLVNLPGIIISNAVVLAQLRSEDHLTYSLICSFIPQVVEMYRALADGQRIDVPVIIGLRGVSIETDTSYKLDGTSTLRGVRRVEKDFLLHNPEQVTSVLETIYPLGILKVSNNEESAPAAFEKDWRKYTPLVEEGRRTVERRIDRVRLAILLASRSSNQPLATSVVSRFTINLAQSGGIQWDAETRPHATFPLEISDAETAVSIYKVILEKHPDSLKIAQKRILSATSRRWDATDAFIDAVVVWENVFGTRTETTFRVTGAVAKLLEPEDMGRRLALQKELRDLYGKRSSLVHGAKEPKPEQSWRMKERAIEITIDILRELYLNRPDLLELESEIRSNTLLLEGYDGK